MDLKFKSRKWIGSIYHKFEAMCHEVDEFVTKDTAKYIENQVQTVNESVKKIYSDVLHEFEPPPTGIVQQQEATEKQDDATGTSMTSTVDVDGTPSPCDEIQLPRELDIVNHIDFISSEVDRLGQHSLSPCAAPEDEKIISYRKKDIDTAFPKTMIIPEQGIRVENWEACHSSYSKDINSTNLPMHSLEQHQLTMSVGASHDGNVPLQPASQDSISIIQDELPKYTTEDVGLRISQEEETKSNRSGLSGKTETWFSSVEIDDTLVWNDSDWAAEENVMVDHPDFEDLSCSKDKNFYKLLKVKETTSVVDDLSLPEDITKSFSSLSEGDHKSVIAVKQLSEVVVPDERISCTSMMQTIMDDYADLSEELKTKLALGESDMGLNISLPKEHQLTNSEMVPSCTRSPEFSVDLREQLRWNAESSLENGECLPEIMLTFNDSKSVDKFLPESSISAEGLRISEDEEGGNSQRCFVEKAETDLSFNNEHSWVLSDFSLEDNGLLQKHMPMKCSDCFEDLSDLSVSSRDLHLGVEGLDSPEYGTSTKSSLRSGAEEHTTTIAPNSVLIYADQNSGFTPLPKDITTQAKYCNVLCTDNATPDNFSLEVSSAHHAVQAEESSSLSTESLRTNYNKRTEKLCSDYTTPICSASDLSTKSHLSLPGFVSDDKIGNQIPAFSRTASSADVGDDLAGDIVDSNLVTIDLSDKENLEGSCPVVDDELFCTPSFRAARKYRSYKELIKEAFASRKRLVKEYKQLPIWYGNFDNYISRLPEKHLLPPTTSPSASESTLASSHPCDIGESDWELI